MSKTDAAPLDGPEEEDAPKAASKAPLFIGLALFLTLGSAGFYAGYAGLAPSPFAAADSHEEGADKAAPRAPLGQAPAFVALDEIIVPLAPGATSEFLAITAQIEVAPEDAAYFEQLKPRFLDVLNTFLRAVQISDLEEPSAMLRLRAQLLRRISVVAAPAAPRDLLITSFVLQ